MPEYHLPRAGEIWTARASVKLPVLETAVECSIAPISATMQSDLVRLKAGVGIPDRRPVIILDGADDKGMVTVAGLATFNSAQDIDSVNEHLKHFTLPFGETLAGPDGIVVKPEGVWKKSLSTPTFVVARVTKVRVQDLRGRYTDDDGTTHSLGVMTLVKLQRLCDVKMKEYNARVQNTAVFQQMNESYDNDARRRAEERELDRRIWGNVAASAPPEISPASQGVRMRRFPMSSRRNGWTTSGLVSGPEKIGFGLAHRIDEVDEEHEEQQSSVAKPLDLSIDDENVWPHLKDTTGLDNSQRSAPLENENLAHSSSNENHGTQSQMEGPARPAALRAPSYASVVSDTDEVQQPSVYDGGRKQYLVPLMRTIRSAALGRTNDWDFLGASRTVSLPG